MSDESTKTINLSGRGIPNDRQRFGVPSVYRTSDVNEVHPQIQFQVPEFIQEEHRQFLSFMQEYYRFTEKSGGPLHFLRRLLAVQDIDRTVNDLLEYFFQEYSPSFPRDTALSAQTIIKNIKQFYQAKGSEKSFRFLFRVLFGQEIDFYYPRLDILRFSDAKWVQDRTIKCVLSTGQPNKLIGNRIVGASSRASAFVEKILLVQDGSITTYELFLNRSSIVGKFQPNETIRDENNVCTLRALPIVSKIVIDQPGKGYKDGQEVVINGVGFNCKARVSSVGQYGEIQSVEIYQFGAGYTPNTTSVEFPTHSGVITQASGRAVFDTITKYPGYFLNSDGMFSSLKRIQDSHYYQQFSYVIRAEESRNRYEDIVKKLVHPSGYIFFSEVFSEARLDATSELPTLDDGTSATESEMFTDLRLDYNEFEQNASEYVFADSVLGIDDEFDVELFSEDVTYDGANRPLGPTWADWDQWKTDYRPTPVFGKPDDEILQPDYYNLYANTPLKAFAHVQLSVFADNQLSSIDHIAESSVSQFVTESYSDQTMFPPVGVAHTIYFDESERKSYLWLPETDQESGVYQELE